MFTRDADINSKILSIEQGTAIKFEAMQIILIQIHQKLDMKELFIG